MRREKSRSQAPMSGAAAPRRSPLTRNRPATLSGTLASTGMSIPPSERVHRAAPLNASGSQPPRSRRRPAPRPPIARPARPASILVVPGPPRQRRLIGIRERPRRRCASAWSSCACGFGRWLDARPSKRASGAWAWEPAGFGPALCCSSPGSSPPSRSDLFPADGGRAQTRVSHGVRATALATAPMIPDIYAQSRQRCCLTLVQAWRKAYFFRSEAGQQQIL